MEFCIEAWSSYYKQDRLKYKEALEKVQRKSTEFHGWKLWKKHLSLDMLDMSKEEGGDSIEA